jgi:hypothetical protein
MSLAEALYEKENVFFPLAYSSEKTSFFGSTNTAKISTNSYHCISVCPAAKVVDLGVLRSGIMAASTFVYRYTSITGKPV